MNETAVIQELTRFVDELPSNGEWWKSSSRDDFVRMAELMLRYKVPPSEIESILQTLYYATKEEYGD